jgi:hypothetical protein
MMPPQTRPPFLRHRHPFQRIAFAQLGHQCAQPTLLYKPPQALDRPPASRVAKHQLPLDSLK